MTAYNFTSLQQVASPWMPGTINTVGAYFDIADTTTGLADADTITAANLIPPSGVKILEVKVLGAPMDTNNSATGTFEVGDSLSDTDAAARYMTAASMGKSNGDNMLVFQNVAPTLTDGVYTKGVGYVYTTDQASNDDKGFVDVILKASAAPATAATSGIVYLYVTYACVGLV